MSEQEGLRVGLFGPRESWIGGPGGETMRAWLSAILNVDFVDDFSIAVVNFVVL